MNSSLNQIRILIIDDEIASISLLKRLLEEIPIPKTIASFSNSEEGYNYLTEYKPDLLFLDIQMPGMDGIEILKRINYQELHTHVIIVTAYEELVLKAAHWGLIDYLLKPIDKDKLNKSLNSFFMHDKQHKANEITNFFDYLNNKILIPSSFEDYFFPPNEICYLEADSNYTNIFTTNGNKFTSSFHLGKLQYYLPEKLFFRVSRSTIINFSHLKRIDKRKKVCVISVDSNEREIPYTKAYLKRFNFCTFE
jgi:two-component system, LytTR family, response regulator